MAAMTNTMSVRRLTRRRCGSNPTVPSIAPTRTVMVASVRRLSAVVILAGAVSIAAPVASSMTTAPVDATSTTVASTGTPDSAPESNIFVPVPAEEGPISDDPAVTTTSTTLPSAVTTIPPDCPSPPTALAVFTGEVVSTDSVSALFAVDQVRAGILDGFLADGKVSVRYGGDARYLESGSRYIVGVVAGDSLGTTLVSTLRDEAQVLGEAEGLALRIDCPEFEPVARTLTIGGTTVPTGTFSLLFDSPLRVLAALVLPALLVLVLLVGAVWAKRGFGR